MIKDEPFESISELRANFVTALNGASTDLKSSVIKSLAKIKDLRFLDINDNEQLQAFADIGDTDDDPIFISRYAMYLLDKKKLSEKTEEQQDELNKFFESSLKFGECFANNLQEMAYILSSDIGDRNLQDILVTQLLCRDDEKVESYIFYNALYMMRYRNSNFDGLMKTMWNLDSTFDLNSDSDAANKITNYIRNVFEPEISNGVKINKIFNRLMYVIAIVKQQQ